MLRQAVAGKERGGECGRGSSAAGRPEGGSRSAGAEDGGADKEQPSRVSVHGTPTLAPKFGKENPKNSPVAARDAPTALCARRGGQPAPASTR